MKELLEYYETPEVLRGDNRVWCPTCQGLHDHEKAITFWKLPYIFVLVLKRFEGPDQYGQTHKRYVDVTTPMRINLNRFEKNGKSLSYKQSEGTTSGAVVDGMPEEGGRHHIGGAVYEVVAS